MYPFVINTLRPAALLFDEDLRSTFIPQLLLQQQQIDMMEEKWKILRLFYPQSCRDMEWVGLVVVEEDTTINNNQRQQHH